MMSCGNQTRRYFSNHGVCCTGIQDAEYLYALESKTPRSAKAEALLHQARQELATHFPSGWNPQCLLTEKLPANWVRSEPTQESARQSWHVLVYIRLRYRTLILPVTSIP